MGNVQLRHYDEIEEEYVVIQEWDTTDTQPVSGLTINTDYILTVDEDGAIKYTTVVDYGYIYLNNGGRSDDTTVGSAVDTRYGYFYLNGGSAYGTTVYDGGYFDSYESGYASRTTLESGAIMSVDTGVTIADTTVKAGATLSILGRSTGSLSIAAGAVVILSGTVEFDPDSNYRITVSETQANGRYVLVDGSGNFAPHDLTLTVGDTGRGVLTIDGETLVSEGVKYSLFSEVDELVLKVSDSAGDLNGDGRADIVMTIAQEGHPADGSTGAWLITDTQTAAWGNLSQRGAGWEIFGTGYTAVGKTTNDVYVKSTGNVIGAWTTDDTGSVSGWVTVGEFDASTQILGLGDFNGDRQTDLLLRNTNGAVGCYFTSGDVTGWNYFQSLGDEWTVSAVGDLNGDGRDDVVLKHDAGFAGSWLTQEDYTMAWANLDTLADGFEIVGCGDFNGDGIDDVLLQSGSYYGAWIVEDGSVSSWMGLGDLGSVSVEQIGDFDGDNVDDLRVRTAGGDLGAQLVKGADTLEWKYYGSVGDEWSTALTAL